MRITLSLSFVFFCAASLFSQKDDSLYAGEILLHRQHYIKEFLDEPRAPVKVQDTAFLQFYAPDPAWRVSARFERSPDAAPFDMGTYSGQTARYVQYGTLQFSIGGKTQTLRVYQNLRLAGVAGYADYLFLPFKDHTNGETTYGGGRYLDFRTGDIGTDGSMTLDFNKAYNPYCAYSDGYSCPIPPKENHLEMEVPVGEKLFGKAHKH